MKLLTAGGWRRCICFHPTLRSGRRRLRRLRQGGLLLNVRLDNTTVQDYVLYRVAKGLCSGMLGATSEELADPELVSDDTLLLILCAALIARYGPEVTNIGRAE